MAGYYLGEAGTPSSIGAGGVADATNIFDADSSWINPVGMTGLSYNTV